MTLCDPDFDRRQVPAVVVVGRTRAFGRYHRGALRSLGRTLRAKRGTVRRFLQALEDLTADANLRLARPDILYLENALCIEIAEGVTEFVAALGNDADSAPAPVG